MNKETYRYNLSILLVSYNHEQYITKAISSIFDQVIEGPIEIVIADDASTDNTLKLIKSFEYKNPKFHFKFLDNTKNVGITKNYQRGFAACNGKYVAVLEGDDYWSSDYKLQRQSDFLENHLECDLCSVNYLVFEEEKAKFTPRTTISNGHRFLTAQELIMDNLVGNFSTCMYRKSALLRLPTNLFDIQSYDWIVNICVAQGKLIGFIEEPMSVYRLHEKGVWSRLSHVQKLKEQAELIPAYNAITNFQFNKEFSFLLKGLDSTIAQMSGSETSTNQISKLRARVIKLAAKIKSKTIFNLKKKQH